MPSNFIEKYLGKSRRTKVALSLSIFLSLSLFPCSLLLLLTFAFPHCLFLSPLLHCIARSPHLSPPSPPVTSYLPATPARPSTHVSSPQPRRDRTVLERNIAFSSSRKQNPFLPLEHSVEIDSAYIGLLAASQTVGRHSLFLFLRLSFILLSPRHDSAVVFPLILCTATVRMPAVAFLYGCLRRGRRRRPP